VIEASPRAWDEPSLDLPVLSPDEIAQVTSAAIERANARIDAAVSAAAELENRGAAPAFEELFGALDDAAREVAIAFGQGAAQNLLASDDAVREAAFAANERIEGWRASLPMRDDLQEAVAAFAAGTDLATLDDIERRYVERWQRDIRLAGGGLSKADREEIERITNRLLELGSAFQSNLAKAPHIAATPDELDGLPDGIRSTATPIDGDDGHLDLEVNGDVYIAIVERAPNRALRERAYRAWTSRGVPVNLPLLHEATTLRRRYAEICGFPSWQAYRIDNLAAPDAAFINRFIDDLAARLGPITERELEAMQEVLRARPGGDPDLEIQDWDWRYADAIQRDALGADPDRLRDYFELERVLAGLNELSAEVFGVRLEARPERRGWDPGVRAFDLFDVETGRLLAHLFLDAWTRSGKQNGAWMEILLPGGGRHDEGRVPTIELCMNVQPPAHGPALLNVWQVDTLFHEFGHVLNFAIAAPRFVPHRQTWIPFDFIEGPSEFNGRWGTQPSVVARFARHHATNEPIPTDLVEAVQRSESLNVSVETLRLLAQCKFDALVHGEDEIPLEEAQAAAWAMRGIPPVDGTFIPAALGHILGGAYDAALYGYCWSQVIRDELLETFAAGGLLSPEMGARYRRSILGVAWYDDPVAAVNEFLGRPWSSDAFLRRAAGES
jgi:Zn-dependent oligopeptidase